MTKDDSNHLVNPKPLLEQIDAMLKKYPPDKAYLNVLKKSKKERVAVQSQSSHTE